jgi:DNA-entry nuclease
MKQKKGPQGIFIIFLILFAIACFSNSFSSKKPTKTPPAQTAYSKGTSTPASIALKKSQTPKPVPSKIKKKSKIQKKIKLKKIKVKKTTIKKIKIPSFSGKSYTVVHHNQPQFKKSELTTKVFEHYHALDSLGRCGTACANVCARTMPHKTRLSISSVKPTGWKNVRYHCVEGSYLYNRCHLIGYQLTGENANPRNLITGTRYLNIHGMLPFENKIANYVKETGHHVLYRVKPIFHKNNLVASGVTMEAESVEDKGKGLSFYVYCYNNEPGVKINYATGTSRSLSGDSGEHTAYHDTSSKNSSTQQNTKHDSKKHSYIINTNTRKFHIPSCSSVQLTKASHQKKIYCKRSQLIHQGYSPCKRCNP